jgi:16S rRNA (guanine966-N2)-methyltransferase
VKRGGAGVNRVRIIGGEHKGRRLNFPDAPGLRPTADRVRETLFNWLQPVLAGARCMDLFAGSGALGLEAASRGAGFVMFVEKSPKAAARLNEHLNAMQLSDRAQVRNADAGRVIRVSPDQGYDVVFLDPPFTAGLLERTAQALEQNDWLVPAAWIYLEQDAAHPWPELPDAWGAYREGQAGQASFRLMKRMRATVAGC